MGEELPFGSRGGIAIRHTFPGGRRVQLSRFVLRGNCTATCWDWAGRNQLEVRLERQAGEVLNSGRRCPQRALTRQFRREYHGRSGVGSLHARRRTRVWNFACR